MKKVGILFCLCAGILDAYTMQKLTILTGLIGTQSSTEYLGHVGVTRSLVEGLKKIGASFNYNPSSTNQVGDMVHIVSGAGEVIEQVIALKQAGAVKKIIVGPNAYSYHYVNHPAIDLRIDPSAWVRDAHLLHHAQRKASDYLIWPAGVDEEYFKPSGNNNVNSRMVLIYNKEQNELTNQVMHLLQKYRFQAIIVTYGSYQKDQFKQLLDRVLCAVFLSKTESQGLALAECWSMNVPTLCWNLECSHRYLGIDYPISSACPYLTAKTGMVWKTLQDLESLIKEMPTLFKNCSPRAWVLEHMTDEVVARQLLAAIEALE